MNAYSLDLRKKIVAAKERGMPTSEVARTFGVGTRALFEAHVQEALAPSLRPGQRSW